MNEHSYIDLPDLAAESLGGWAMWANDEFFAEKENLLKAHAAEWREHAYTDRGKWMDGWETRRRRGEGDRDVCVVRLGLPGRIRGFVVDTAFFRGNFPAECMLEGASIETHADLRAIADESTQWVTLVERSKLAGDSKNQLAAIACERPLTHVRLTIFPDGGVARLRVHGEPAGAWQGRQRSGALDLAALENGARSLACSDMFFGSRHHLILPGKPLTMGGGWETRRRRGPGHDWNLVALAARGRILHAEIDTMHFKGNAPARCSIEACDVAGAPDAASLQAHGVDWRVLLPETPLQPHTLHRFEDELRVVGPVTHVRLNVFPDGGIARLRCIGEPEEAAPGQAGLDAFNRLPADEATGQLLSCCASGKWAQAVLRRRPFEEPASLFRAAERAWWSCDGDDWRQAFAAHPRIGERPAAAGQPARHAEWSLKEQGGASGADQQVLARLAEQNRAYEDKFGFTYIVCASGKSADQMLSILERRLSGTQQSELRTAAEEQAKITQLRLRKLLAEGRSAR